MKMGLDEPGYDGATASVDALDVWRQYRRSSRRASIENASVTDDMAPYLLW
jgi:hypothetical protein